MIHIGLCTDNRYAMPCGVCVTSLFENNKDEEITVYVLEKGLTDDNKEKLGVSHETSVPTLNLL